MMIKPIQATTEPVTQGMDCLFSLGMELTPHVTTCGDMSPVSDFLDASIYASSPNSLFMYDQEKVDMQCSYGGNPLCSVMDDACFGDDFELSSNYEVSQDISSLQMKEIPNQSHTSSGGWSNKDEQKDVYIKSESTGDESTPTLAELNLNFDLLEDIDSYINIEMGSKVPDLQLSVSTDMVKDVKQVQEVCELSVKRCYGKNGNVRTMPGSVYQSMPKVNIKQEPADNIDGNHQTSFTQLLSISQPSGKGLGLGTSTKQPLSTIREIDISDCQTLQKLLTKISNSQPVKATIPRKRFVSESIEDPCFKPSVPKRPASVSGLNSMDLKWEEIKHFLHIDESPIPEESNALSVKKERTRYDSSSSVMTLTSNEDEEESADSDKDFDDDSDSDLEGGADMKFLSSTESLIGSKDKQHFWQYNVQSKGPKGTRVHFDLEEDPHVLNDFEDPVFDLVNSDNLSSIGVAIKHGGKARKGDGNDIVPSPKKLCQIGLQLRKINKQINDFVLVKELPASARSKTRKEKNKLASRACRLKKKAQHEANKVKLNGLEIEHRKLLTVIRKIRKSLLDRLNSKYVVCPDQPSMTDTLQALMMEHLGTMIAGNTVDYVNSVIHKVEAGDLTGGLLIKVTRSYPKELHK